MDDLYSRDDDPEAAEAEGRRLAANAIDRVRRFLGAKRNLAVDDAREMFGTVVAQHLDAVLEDLQETIGDELAAVDRFIAGGASPKD